MIKQKTNAAPLAIAAGIKPRPSTYSPWQAINTSPACTFLLSECNKRPAAFSHSRDGKLISAKGHNSLNILSILYGLFCAVCTAGGISFKGFVLGIPNTFKLPAITPLNTGPATTPP